MARAVGQYVAAFARLEQELYISFGKVLGTDYNGAMQLLGHIQSFSTRLTAIKTFLPATALTTDDKKTGTVVFGIAKECNNFRNKLIHGQWGLTDAGQLRLVPWATSTTKKSKAEAINAKLIDDRRTLDLDRCVFINRMFQEGQPLPPPPFRPEPTIVPK